MDRTVFEIAPGADLFLEAPRELEALYFFRRQPAGPTARLLAVGDIGFSGRVGEQGASRGYSCFFEGLQALFRTGDIVFANLETPLVCADTARQMFTGSPETAEALAKAGFTLVNVANNHIRDLGAAGLKATLEALTRAGLLQLGAGLDQAVSYELIRTDVRGLRVGWFGCAHTRQDQLGSGPYFYKFDLERLLDSVRRARPSVDLLIVSIHAGLMFLDYPKPEDKLAADRLRVAGADLILMHHAHVLQGVQADDHGRSICFNLGNFLFDWQEGNVTADVMVREQQEGAVFLFEFDHTGICRAAAVPTYMDSDLAVRWATGQKGRGILDRLARISSDIEGDYIPLFAAQRAERNAGHGLRVVWFHLKRGHLRLVLDLFRKVRLEHCLMLWRWVLGILGGVGRR